MQAKVSVIFSFPKPGFEPSFPKLGVDVYVDAGNLNPLP